MKKFFVSFHLLLRSIPSPLVAFFTLSVVLMNLLANKTILSLDWLALDGGFLLSFVPFLCMDIVTKYYGQDAGDKLNVFALFVNLFCVLVFYVASAIPTQDDYSAFNSIFGGTWFILMDSMIAFVASGFFNNALNTVVGKMFKKNPDGGAAFFVRSYVSTFFGQYVDNFLFSFLTFYVFAPIFWGEGARWNMVQILMGALTGALAELLMEVFFSPIGLFVVRRWKKEGVGKEYFEAMASFKEAK